MLDFRHTIRNYRSWLSLMARSSGLGAAPTLQQAISATVRRQLSADETSRIAGIEKMRQRMSESTQTIQTVDFGAVNPDAPDAGGSPTPGGSVKLTRIVGEICKTTSRDSTSALMLYQIIRKFQPATCIEMGTSLGVSASYIGTALKLNGKGRLVTLEGAGSVADIARQNLAALGLDNVEVRTGPFSETLGPALEAMRPLDFIFVDGHHDELATKAYFDQILPYLSPSAVIVFDDIKWSDGMRRAWDYVARSHEAHDLGNFGVWLNKPRRGAATH